MPPIALPPSSRLLLLPVLATLTACATTRAAPDTTPEDKTPTAAQASEAPAVNPVGRTFTRAIEVCDPEGQRAYLRCLVCPDGTSPQFKRQGNYGSREDGIRRELAAIGPEFLDPRESDPALHRSHVVDGYLVACGDEVELLVFDMYHCDPSKCGDPFLTCKAPKNPGPPSGYDAFPDCLENLFSAPVEEASPRASPNRP